MKEHLRDVLIIAAIAIALLVAAQQAGFVGDDIARAMARFIKWDF